MKGVAALSIIASAAACSLTPGEYEYNVTAPDGLNRRYGLYVPEGLMEDVPLHMTFHGAGNLPAQFARSTGLKEISEDLKFMYAWGFGHGLSTGWNAGWCCNQAASQQTDDVGYVLEMVRDIEERSGCLDHSKIYGSGFSNGGFFVERLACEQPGLMAGIAPVAGCLTDYKNPNAGTSNVDSAIRTCEGDHTAAGGAPVARMSIHGNGDPAVPYVGNPVVGFVSQDDSVELWTKFNTCGSETEIVIDDGTTVCTEYINCEDGARVQQCQGPYSHSWPSFASRHMATFFDSL